MKQIGNFYSQKNKVREHKAIFESCPYNSQKDPLEISSFFTGIFQIKRLHFLFLCFLALCVVHCNPSFSGEKTEDTKLLKGLVLYQAKELRDLKSSFFELNGAYQNFIMPLTTSKTNTYINAERDKKGLWLDDIGDGDTTTIYSSGFPTEYSNCYLIEKWSTSKNYLITRNPPNNGNCYAEANGYVFGFSGSNNNGTFNKIIWTNYKSNIYYCTTAYNKQTLNEAENDSTIVDTSNPETGACGVGTWYKLVKQ